MKTAFRLAVLALLAFSAFAQQPEPPAQAELPVDMLWGLKIPMRDGARLNGTVFKPHDQKAPLPVIFTLTPYVSDSYQNRAMYFARNGYVFVLVDVRGRGNSEGKFEPFAQEPKDGHDVVEFLAMQPWSNGKVTMWGGSYAGYDQWATAKEFPPHLATIVPAAAAYPAVDFPFTRGVFGFYDIQWLTFTSGDTANDNLFGQADFWIEKAREAYLNHLPYNQIDKLAGNDTTVFQKWLQHPSKDEYWNAMAPTPQQYANFSLPILTITGDYDGDQMGALTYYRNHMRYGNEQAKANHYLIMGPWDHAGTRTPRREVGGLKFGEASMLDLNKLHKEWYDWTLKSGPKPEFLKKRVAYYVIGTGAEKWKYADSLDAIPTEHRTLFLASDGKANDVFHSGTLIAGKPVGASTDHYAYDPLDTSFGEQFEKEDLENNITDERYATQLGDSGLIYHTAPFDAATEISGYVTLTAYMSLDVPDTDFTVNLYEIMPDGTSVQLTGDLVRARFRNGLDKEELVKQGEIIKYQFTGFTWFSRMVSKGSRLRLVINSPNSIYLEKNYNSGGVVADETAKDARTAHITLYHDAEHPSALVLPIVK